MGLIPLPQEVAQVAKKTEKLKSIMAKLKEKANYVDQKLLKRTCIKMASYLAQGGNFSINEVNELIDDMHRSILLVQKRKQKLQIKRRG